jgi:radical SAM protein with 4Fe4S-binding SPASM domain
MQIKNPEISVIMCAYNAERFIVKAVESIINQTFGDWELIIIDDASKDSTLRIIKNYQKEDCRIRIVNLKRNIGPAAARNAGLRIAKGKYIAVLDSDDVALPRRLEVQYNYLENHPEVFLICSSFEYIDEKGRKIMEEKYPEIINIIPSEMYWFYWLHHSSAMFKNSSEAHYRNKLRQNEDKDLFIRLIEKNKKLQIIPELLTEYRIHAEALSVMRRKEQEYFNKQVRELEEQRVITGQDSYKRMNVKTIQKNNLEERLKTLKLRKKEYIQDRKEALHQLRKKIISEAYERRELQKFRTCLITQIYLDGIKIWKKEIPYYFISFIPIKIKEKIKLLLQNLISKIKMQSKNLNNLLKYGTEDIFNQVDIETITCCNRRCLYCPNSIYENGLIKNKKLLSTKLFHRIIKELAEIKYKGIINLNFYGEPLLDKRIISLVKYAKNKLPCCYIIIYTNGDFLTLSYYKKLVLAGVDEFRITQHSKKEDPEIIKILEYTKIRPEDNIKISYQKLKFTNNRGGLIESGKPIKLEECHLFNPHVVINYKGEVILCCQDYFSSVKFGSIKDEKLLDIWKKPEYQRIRKEIRKGKPSLEICKKCLGIRDLR